MASRQSPASRAQTWFEQQWPREVRRDPFTYVGFGLIGVITMLLVGLAGAITR